MSTLLVFAKRFFGPDLRKTQRSVDHVKTNKLKHNNQVSNNVKRDDHVSTTKN